MTFIQRKKDYFDHLAENRKEEPALERPYNGWVKHCKTLENKVQRLTERTKALNLYQKRANAYKILFKVRIRKLEREHAKKIEELESKIAKMAERLDYFKRRIPATLAEKQTD